VALLERRDIRDRGSRRSGSPTTRCRRSRSSTARSSASRHWTPARVLELRYFGGLSLEETAEAVGISLATVKRELRSARAWLALELRGEPSL
jgi:DNA-directed RNA polymerase specialized sigma24 family protein